MADVAIEARGLSRRYGDRWAVRDISFTTGAGRVVGLLGPNGAGKTTTIRLLTAILEPTAGELTVAGVPGTDAAGIRRRIGVLPESAGYPGQQTGREHLRFFAHLHGVPRDRVEAVVGEGLRRVGLADRAGSRIATYSRGMRQRLGIARALLHEPPVVFLDEPTLGLDPAGQREVLEIIRRIAADGRATVVVSTHALAEVEQLCTDVLILDGGRVVAAGTVAEVVRRAGVRETACLRVPPGLVAQAREALRRLPDLVVDRDPLRRDQLRLTALRGHGRSGADLNLGLRAVLDAGVPVLAFDLDAVGLADAFLAVTGGGSDGTR